MSLGGFRLQQFKITYNSNNYSSYLEYGCDLLSKYANCIINASSYSDSGWTIDENKTDGDYEVNDISIYNLQTRVPVWGTAYPEGSYNICCFLKYDNGTTVRHLYLMLNSCLMVFNTSYSSSAEDKDSFPFYKYDRSTNAPYWNPCGGVPVTFGAMCRTEEFVLNDIINNSKNIKQVSDTPFFSLTGAFVHSFIYTDRDSNINYRTGSLTNPEIDESYVLGTAVKNDIIISIFRKSSWSIGNYNVMLFGDIINCYNDRDNKKFTVIQGCCNYASDWYNDSNLKKTNNIENIYAGLSYPYCFGYTYESGNTFYGLTKEYLNTIISSVTENRHFLACTGSYLSFYDNISNNLNGSKYKGHIDTEVFRQCNECQGSEVVLDGNFIRIGSCLVGWDYSNPNLL